MKKQILTLLLCCFFKTSVFSQIGTVSGTVVSDTVNDQSTTLVQLLSKDSALIKTTQADSLGNFVFQIFKSGEYRIKIERSFFESYYIEKFSIDSSETVVKINIGTISLKRDFKNLAPVIITSKKKFIERKFNKTIVNVSESVFAQGNSMFEFLQILPGVGVNPSGAIQVNGKSNILVQLDGKGQVVPADQVAALLKSIQASNIEKIEIVQTPSAKYDGAVSAVINIITNKKKAQSDLRVGYGSQVFPLPDENGFNYINANIGTTVNTNIARVNIIGSLDYRLGKNIEQNRENIYFKNQNPNLLSSSNSLRTNKNDNLAFMLGLNYNINKKQFVDLLFNTTKYLHSNNSNNTQIAFMSPTQIVPDSGINSSGKSNNNVLSFNAFNAKYIIQTAKAGEELGFYFDYNLYTLGNSSVYENEVYYSKPSSLAISSLLTTLQYNVSIASLKLDYTVPLNKKMFIDVGGKLSRVKNKSDFEGNKNLNNFRYDELISAGYLSLRNQNEKLQYELGMRFENTHSTGSVLNFSNVITRNYLNTLPTVSAQYTINSSNNIDLSYKTSIRRPNYANFNPTTIVSRPFTTLTGTNQLDPQVLHTGSLSYSYKSYTLTLMNDYSTDLGLGFIDSSSTAYSINTKWLTYSKANIATIMLQAPVKFTKKWNSNNTISGYLSSVKLLNGHWNNFKTFDINSNHTYKLSPSLSTNLSLFYSYFNQTGYWKTLPIFNCKLALQKTWKDKYVLNFSLNDIFGTAQLSYDENYGYILRNYITQTNGRNFRISLRYRFNSGLALSKKEKRSKDNGNEIRF